MAYDEDYDEYDEENDEEDSEYDSDEEDSDEYDDDDDDDMMKSAIESLTNMEEHIISQTEEQAVIQKSMMVFAEALHSLISMIEEQQESLTTLKSRLGVMSNAPAVNRTPVYSEPIHSSQTDKLSVNKSKLLEIIKKGMSDGRIALEDVSFYEHTGRYSERMQDLMDKESR